VTAAGDGPTPVGTVERVVDAVTPSPGAHTSPQSRRRRPAAAAVGAVVIVALAVALLAVLLLQRRDGGGLREPDAPTSRLATSWPFAASSIWNTPLGDAARLVPAGFVLPEAYGAEENVIVLTPDAPPRPVYQGDGFGDSHEGRCAHTGEVLYELPIPADFTTTGPDGLADQGTPNAASAVLAADGHTLVQSQPLTACGANGPVTTGFEKDPGDLFGDGIAGAQGGSDLSSLGGTLRLGELSPSDPVVRHALKITVDASANLSFSDGGFRWPAAKADLYADATSYGGANPELRMGALLALPADLDLDGLDLQTEPGHILARTLARYGAYVVDDSGQSVVNLAVEHSPEGRFTERFAADWGFDFVTVDGPWKADLDLLFSNLAVVADNGPDTVGGAGARLACPAPPIVAGASGDTRSLGAVAPAALANPALCPVVGG